jgi:hypothetical protein
MYAEPVHKIHDVRGEANAHGHVADGVFQDEIPANDPCDQLAHGGVGVGVGAARDRDHRCQLGIAKAGESADDGHQHDGEGQCGASPRAAGQGVMVHQVIE